MCVAAWIVDGKDVVGVGFQRGGVDDRRPRHGSGGRVGDGVEDARVDAAAGGVIACEETGVDVDRAQPSADSEPHDRPVAVGVPAGLPAVDDLTAQVVGAWHEGGFAGLDQSFLESERFVAGGDDAAAEARDARSTLVMGPAPTPSTAASGCAGCPGPRRRRRPCWCSARARTAPGPAPPRRPHRRPQVLRAWP